MKKVLLLFVPFFLWAKIYMPIQEGWQLIGLPQSVTDLKIFDAQNVKLIWSFNAQTQSWEAYSSHVDVQTKLQNKNIPTITSLQANQGFWVLSLDNWQLEFDADTTPNQEEDKTIILKKGWNLISLSIGTVLSPQVFGDDIVWKYTEANEWQSFSKDLDLTSNTPMHSIDNRDGIWVYTQEDKTVDLNSYAMQMHNFASMQEVNETIEEMLYTMNRPYIGFIDMGIFSPLLEEDTALDTADDSYDTSNSAQESSKAAIEDASTTNTQESDVDEADIVKHDNNKIFYLYKESSTLHSTTFEQLLAGSTQPYSSVKLNENFYPDSMYLNKDTLVILYSSNTYRYSKEEGSDFYISTLLVEFYDVSNLDAITLTQSFELDGYLNNSRLIDDKLYIVSQFMPQISIDYPKVYHTQDCSDYYWDYTEDWGEESESVSVSESSDSSDTQSTTLIKTLKRNASSLLRYSTSVRNIENLEDMHCLMSEYDYDKKQYYYYDFNHPAGTQKYLLPTISNSSKTLITPSNIYAPVILNQYSDITTVSQFDLSSQDFEDALSFVGYSSTLYMSSNALYITSHAVPYYYDFFSYKEQTMLHKISLDPLAYKAKGKVDGKVLNQFSLGEYNDILSVATTEGFSWQANTNNVLTTLKEDENGSFEILGTLEGLGKESEIIKSVRFVKDRGYMVTFIQTDPLYTLDLSDPSNPKKAGELEISGYSEYLHLINDDRLLSFGREADQYGNITGLKWQLFDTSDFNNPTLLDSYNFGTSYSSSELSYNHKAFSFLESQSLFGFPYTYSYLSEDTYYQAMKINSDKDSLDTLDTLDKIQLQKELYNYYDLSRGVFFTKGNKTYMIVFSNDTFYFQEITQ
jgi:uncharacterized secreted protein with C-terminal beta-propeller domain